MYKLKITDIIEWIYFGSENSAIIVFSIKKYTKKFIGGFNRPVKIIKMKILQYLKEQNVDPFLLKWLEKENMLNFILLLLISLYEVN